VDNIVFNGLAMQADIRKEAYNSALVGRQVVAAVEDDI